MSDSKNPSSDPSSQGASSESQIDLSQLDPLHTSTTVTPQSTSSNLIDLFGDMSLPPVLPSPDPVPLLNPIITDEPLAHLYITGIDTYATVEEFENDTVLKRYKKFCSNLRMQTSTVSGKKRIIISFHNRDAVMEAESDLRKSFPGENVNFKIEYIEQEEPITLKQEPGPPTQKEREVTQTEAKPREPIPPATAGKNISTELMIFIKTNFKIHIDNFKLQGTVMYDEDKGTVTITHPDPQELQRFEMNVFNEIDEVLENLTEEEMKLLNSRVQNYSSCIEMICQTETMQIQYLMNNNPNQIHIFGDKLLVSKAMKKLKQTLNAQLAISRNAVIEAESDSQRSFPGENLDFKTDYIEREEPTTLKEEPGSPLTPTEAKPTEPIPPATAGKNISTELMIFIKTKFKSNLENFTLQGTVTYDEDKGTVTITHPDPQELQRFEMNVFNEIDEVLENLNEEEVKLLKCPIQNYSFCIEMICQTESKQIQYLMNSSNPNQIHIFGDKLLVSKAMKKLKQTLNAQLAISRNAVIEAESDSQRSFPGENLDFKTDYIEREEPTTLEEEPGSPLTQTEAKPTEPIPPTTASKNISTELMIFIRTNFKSDLEKFKLQGTVTCDEGEKTVTITHPDPQELQRFERNVFNEIDEVLENLTEEEMKLLKSPVQNYSSCIDIICQTESNQIQYLMNSNPNQIHIFGDKLLVSKAMKKLKQTLSAQLAISRPLVFFFKSFPSVLHPNTNQFHISDLTVTIKGTSSVEQCKEIRDSMLRVVSSCCVYPLKISQKLLRPAHVFITRNDLCVCLLIQTQDGEFLDKADRAIPGGNIYVCGLKEHIDPLIPVLENPIEERVSISQKALTKLTETTDKGTNLLEKIKAKSKVSISMDEQTVIITGFIHDDINAMVEELKKNFEDVNIVLDECYLDPLQKSYLLDQRTEFKSQIIQRLELTFQLKVEVQGSQICLSGDQDSFRNLEANPRKLAEFFEHRIPIRTVCKEVEERSAQLFARLIFRYLGDLSSQEHFFVFLIDKKRMQMTIRPGFCEIPILLTAADSIIVSIESRIKELRPKCEIVKLKREDLNLVSRDSSNKIKQIEASEYLRIIPDSQECKLQVFSIGLSSRTAQKMIDFSLSDQYYSRNLPITPMLAFYIQEKKLINIFTKKWQCHMKIIEVKENEEFITHCQIDGRRESLEKLANHITTMDKDLTSKSVEVNYPTKKFCSQFHAEILEVLTSIKGDSNIVIDTRSIAGKDPTSIGKAKVNFISTSNSDINDLSSRFSDLIKFSETTPLTLLPAQHAKLASDMLPTLTNLSLNRHYYIVLNRENVFIRAINHFANTALPCGEYDLQPYLEISSCEYRADNLAIFNLLNNQSSQLKLNTLGVGNSVNIKPPASLEQPFKLEGKHTNVQTVLAEIKKYVQELWQYLGTCEVSVHCPLSAIQADTEIIKFLSGLSHPSINIQYEFPSQVSEGLIASYEVALKTHILSIDLRKGDITKLKVDAIVNAANDDLDHCGGVALAISNAGGPIVQQSSTEHVKRHGKVPVSHNVMLPPGNLPCQSVIHAVGPIWDSMNQNKVKNELGQCVFNICQQAASANLSSIAIPTISAGIFGFPLQLSTSIIIEAIDHFFSIQSNHSIRKLILIDIQDEAFIQFQNVFNQKPKFRSCPIPKKALSSTPQIIFEWQGHDDQWHPFSEMDYNKIRTAYSADPRGTAQTSRGKHTYTVDFAASIETNDQTHAKRKIQIINLVPTTESVPKDDDSPPASWKTIASEKVEFFGLKTILDSIKQQFTVLTRKLVSQTGFPVTCQMKDLIRIVDSFKTEYIKFDLTKSEDGNIKVLIEGFAKEVIESEKNITAELMKLLMADLAQDQRLEPTPQHWDPQTANEMCKLVRLQPTQPEYLKVFKAFQSTLPNAAIVKIERIQNTWLWTRYQQDMQRIVQKSTTGANELILFHGTRTTDPISVYNGAQGFDCRFSREGMWGNANYFAVNASYSKDYAHTLGDGNKQIFSVRICAGDVIDLPSDSTLRLPPPKLQTFQVILPTPHAAQVILPTPQAAQVILPTPQAALAPQFANDPYDTVSGDTHGSKVYMIYENGRAYPEYLITYR